MAGNVLCRKDHQAELRWQLKSVYQIQRDKEVALRFCAAILVGCELCIDETSLQDLLEGKLVAGSQVTHRNFVIETDTDGCSHYSFFCNEGHFTDDVKLPPITQIALNQVVEPLTMLVKT